MAGYESKTILLVEDEELLRDVIEQLLTMHGYKVLTANDGLQALEVFKAEKSHVDLVLTDLNMPNMGGVELVRQVLLIQPNMRVIFTSGYSEHISQIGAMNIKNSDFLPKPASKLQLLTTVRSVLD